MTIGYGDYTPISYLGRMYCICLFVVGIMCVNLINYSFLNLIKFSQNENTCYYKLEENLIE